MWRRLLGKAFLLRVNFGLGGKNNLLKDNDFTINIKAGLGHLKNVGWLSEREETELRSRL
jgi:hypothetical protein